MRSKVLDANEGRRTIVVVFDPGDEVAGGMLRVATEQALAGCHFTGIGAFSNVVLGFWDSEIKDYAKIPIREQVEALSLVGNIALDGDGKPKVHAHVVVGKRDGTAHGGHLLEGHVQPTLEIVIAESAHSLRRRIDPETRLPLLVP